MNLAFVPAFTRVDRFLANRYEDAVEAAAAEALRPASDAAMYRLRRDLPGFAFEMGRIERAWRAAVSRGNPIQCGVTSVIWLGEVLMRESDWPWPLTRGWSRRIATSILMATARECIRAVGGDDNDPRLWFPLTGVGCQ